MATEQNPMVETDALIHDFENKNRKVSSGVSVLVLAVAIFIGVGVGYVLASNNPQVRIGTVQDMVSIPKGTIVGSSDTNTFKDSTQGVVQAGGIGGEGQYHLVRPGGEGQNVYLTSSIVDLSKFIKKKVKVNGQTQAAKKAGWLMDVGRVEVLE